MAIRLRPTLTDLALSEAVHTTSSYRRPIVEGLFYERGITLISGDPAAGKSTVAICAAAHMSRGLPVFGALRCHAPVASYYVIAERTVLEPLERLRQIAQSTAVSWDLLWLDDGVSGICNVGHQGHADELVASIREAWRDLPPATPRIIWLDPAYALMPGGLSKDEPASMFMRFAARLVSELSASVNILHHTSRPIYTTQGTPVDRDDPFYGSQWLKAGCTGAYYLKRWPGHGVLLELKKDTYSTLLPTLPLVFDAATHLLHLDVSHDSSTALSRALLWFSAQGPGTEFTFDAMRNALNVSPATLRRVLTDPSFKSRVDAVSQPGLATIFRIRPELAH